jgi:hypothetical protein
MAQKGPPSTEAPTSLYTSTGEVKSPELRAAEIHAANADQMATRWASQFSQVNPKTGEPYLTASDAAQFMDNDANWQQLADSMGEGLPSRQTRALIMEKLNQMQRTDIPTPRTPAASKPTPHVPTSGPLANNPKALSIAEQLRDMMENQK